MWQQETRTEGSDCTGQAVEKVSGECRTRRKVAEKAQCIRQYMGILSRLVTPYGAHEGFSTAGGDRDGDYFKGRICGGFPASGTISGEKNTPGRKFESRGNLRRRYIRCTGCVSCGPGKNTPGRMTDAGGNLRRHVFVFTPSCDGEPSLPDPAGRNRTARRRPGPEPR